MPFHPGSPSSLRWSKESNADAINRDRKPNRYTDPSEKRVTPQADIADARDQRLELFRARLVHPFNIGVPIVIFISVMSGDGNVVEAIGGALVAMAVIAFIAMRRASREARESFFAAYAGARGLEQHPDEHPPGVTPLLRMGDSRNAERVMTGTLPGGVDGALAHYTYVDRSAENNRRAETGRFTIAVCSLPEVTGRILELYCEPRSGCPSTGITGFRRRNKLQLESVALDRRYEIFYGVGDDENWLHQLHSPSFIIWLSEQTPEGFGFQLSNGYLCAFLPGHRSDAAGLDALCEAASVICRRVVEEVAE